MRHLLLRTAAWASVFGATPSYAPLTALHGLVNDPTTAPYQADLPSIQSNVAGTFDTFNADLASVVIPTGSANLRHDFSFEPVFDAIVPLSGEFPGVLTPPFHMQNTPISDHMPAQASDPTEPATAIAGGPLSGARSAAASHDIAFHAPSLTVAGLHDGLQAQKVHYPLNRGGFGFRADHSAGSGLRGEMGHLPASDPAGAVVHSSDPGPVDAAGYSPRPDPTSASHLPGLVPVGVALSVPEPASSMLFGMGLAGLAALSWRRRRTAGFSRQ